MLRLLVRIIDAADDGTSKISSCEVFRYFFFFLNFLKISWVYYKQMQGRQLICHACEIWERCMHIFWLCWKRGAPPITTHFSLLLLLRPRIFSSGARQQSISDFDFRIFKIAGRRRLLAFIIFFKFCSTIRFITNKFIKIQECTLE